MSWGLLPAVLSRLFVVELVAIGSGLRLLVRRLRGDPLEPALGAILRSALQQLGPVPTKLGQILATRRDVLPARICVALAPLHDRVAPEPLPEAMAQLHRQLGSHASRVTSMTPLAGASVASVYKARLDPVGPVAVKLLRRDISSKIDVDFTILEIGASAAQRVPGLSSLPLRRAVRAVRAMVEGQVNFDREARDQLRLSEGLVEAGVRVPELVSDMITPGCIVMELISDIRSCSDAVDLEPGQRRALATTGLQALYRMIFDDGLIHADLHPGNVGWLSGPPPRLVVLDFGLMARLTRDERLAFARFFLAMSSDNGSECARIILQTAGFVPGALDRTAFTAEVSRVVSRHWALQAARFNVAGFVAELFDVQRVHRVAGSVAFMTTILGLLAFEGTLRTLDPELDFQAEARRYFLQNVDEDLQTRLAVSYSVDMHAGNHV